MATVTHKGLIDQLIAADGYYSDDPRVAEIVEFENSYGGTCWGVTWVNETEAQRHRYRQATPYVQNPRVIWPPSPKAPESP